MNPWFWVILSSAAGLFAYGGLQSLYGYIRRRVRSGDGPEAGV